MIVKASHALRSALYKVPESGIQLTPLPGKVPEKVEDLSHLVPLFPDWLKTMLFDGNLLIIDRLEYLDLPEEISTHLEVISR